MLLVVLLSHLLTNTASSLDITFAKIRTLSRTPAKPLVAMVTSNGRSRFQSVGHFVLIKIALDVLESILTDLCNDLVPSR